MDSPAGVGPRLAAWLVDVLILQPAYLLLVAVIGRGFSSYALWAYLAAPVYMIAWEASRYRASPGKLLLRLEVVDEAGGRLTLGRSVARTSASVLNLLTFWIGFFLCAARLDRLALHDLITHTRVIRSQARSPRSHLPATAAVPAREREQPLEPDVTVLIVGLLGWVAAFLLLWGVWMFASLSSNGTADPSTTLLMSLPFTLMLVKLGQWWRQGRGPLWVVPFKWLGVGLFWPLLFLVAFSQQFRAWLAPPRRP